MLLITVDALLLHYYCGGAPENSPQARLRFKPPDTTTVTITIGLSLSALEVILVENIGIAQGGARQS
jgi:hypothetical protein